MTAEGGGGEGGGRGDPAACAARTLRVSCPEQALLCGLTCGPPGRRVNGRPREGLAGKTRVVSQPPPPAAGPGQPLTRSVRVEPGQKRSLDS